jgi:Uncharacterized protein conserved in bacteria
MKLLVQGDDFGFTRAVTLGIVDSIDRGILRNTGLFTNMPATEFAVSFIKDRPQACFGIDFNIVSGRSVAPASEIPSLVDENGEFIRSTVRIKDPRFATEEGRRAMFPYDEVYREIRAQYDRYVELVGTKPGYLHGHSLGHEHYHEAILQVAEESGVPYSGVTREKFDFAGFPRPSGPPKKEFNPIEQLEKNAVQRVLENSDYFLSHEYVVIVGHPGYIDDELLQLTTLSLERCKDAEMCMSPKILKWVEDNNIELITYYDLYNTEK